MLKRQFQSIYLENEKIGYAPGDEAAHRAAASLADRADAPTIAALTDALMLLERVGGQFHITALRLEDESGEYSTVGIGLHYMTVDARLKERSPPADVLGVPITDAEGPTPELEEAPEEGPDIRDEIEAEAEEPVPEPEPALSE